MSPAMTPFCATTVNAKPHYNNVAGKGQPLEFNGGTCVCNPFLEGSWGEELVDFLDIPNNLQHNQVAPLGFYVRAPHNVFGGLAAGGCQERFDKLVCPSSVNAGVLPDEFRLSAWI